MKNLFLTTNKILFAGFLVLTVSCAKSTKDMVNKQQEIVNNTPLPPDDDVPLPDDASTTNQAPPPNPLAQPVSISPAVSCRLTLLPSLVSVSSTGNYPIGLELGSAEHCVGQLSSGERRDEIAEMTRFQKTDMVAQISIRLISPTQENKANHSTYRAQFFTVQNDQYVPVGQEQTYPLNLKSSSAHISSRIINNGQNKYLLICKARPSCVQ